MGELVNTAVNALATNSPYAVIILGLMYFYSKQNKDNLKQINSMYTTALSEIRKSHKEAMDEIRKIQRNTQNV